MLSAYQVCKKVEYHSKYWDSAQAGNLDPLDMYVMLAVIFVVKWRDLKDYSNLFFTFASCSWKLLKINVITSEI